MVETTFGQQGQGIVNIGIGRHDDRCDAAVLQRAAGARSEFGAQHPADFATADKTEKGHPGVRDHLLSDGVVFQVDGLHILFRQSGLVQYFDEAHAGQRGVQRWFDDGWAASGDGRANLVHDQIEGVIEGRESQHHANRIATGNSHMMGGGGVQIHRDFAPGFGAQDFHATAHAVNRPCHLNLGIRQRLAALARRLHGQFVTARGHQLRGFLKHINTLGLGQPARLVLVDGKGGLQHLVSLLGIKDINCADR